MAYPIDPKRDGADVLARADSMRDLARETREAMRLRGHDPRPTADRPLTKTRVTFQRYRCARCGMTADANARPMPNEIDIGGEAVALNCRDDEREN